MNFKEYLTNMRIVNSIYDLIHTNKKIIDISEKHGFNNVSAYISAFKNYYGSTPNKYRIKHQQKHQTFATEQFFRETDYEAHLTPKEIQYYIRHFAEKHLNHNHIQNKKMYDVS